MIHQLHFEAEIVRPTLNKLSEYDPRMGSQAAVELMMGIAAHETLLGYYLRQHPTGPGRGFWQVEKETHIDVWRYLKRPDKSELREIVVRLIRDKDQLPADFDDDQWQSPSHQELVDNPPYSLAIARVRLWWIRYPLPAPGDIHGQGAYWDKYFNANRDHGTVDEYVENYNKYVLRLN